MREFSEGIIIQVTDPTDDHTDILLDMLKVLDDLSSTEGTGEEFSFFRSTRIFLAGELSSEDF